MDPTGPVAAIDCGTNSTRLLVTDASGAEVVRLMRITRLGQGVDATGVLADDAVARCLGVLTEYREAMDRCGVVAGRLAATSAARDAANGREFLDAAGEVTGLVPELLSGEEEGRLSTAGALGDLGPASGPFLVLDIGGGSTELIRSGGADRPVDAAVSLQLGCVRITERFLADDPPSPTQLAAAAAHVADEVDRAVAARPALDGARTLVGLAGTVSTLAALHLGLEVYDRDRIHHSVLSADAVAGWCRTLAGEPATDRLRRPGMVAGREDVIVGGAVVLRVVMDRLGFGACLVSESDILDGLAASVRSGR
jgi:exopolyphosphatase/guanosine-5'-triphosphate,3'-diphosphate pyrophosphatase